MVSPAFAPAQTPASTAEPVFDLAALQPVLAPVAPADAASDAPLPSEEVAEDAQQQQQQPPALSPEILELRQQLTALQQERATEKLAAEQRAMQERAAQTSQQFEEQKAQHAQQLATYAAHLDDMGMDPEQKRVHMNLLGKAAEYELYGPIYNRAVSHHMASTLVDEILGADPTRASLMAELLKATDAASMQTMAGMLKGYMSSLRQTQAVQRQTQQRAAAVQMGAGRVEGGTAVPSMNFDAIENKIASQGMNALTATERSQYMKLRRERGM